MFISSRKKYSLISHVNVTPFIDVLLVLLIIFMITAEEITTAEEISLPSVASSPQLEKKACTVIISILSDGSVMVENKKINIEDFSAKISSIINEGKDCTALIYGDSKVEYGRVAKLISLLKQNNVQMVSLITQKEGR